MAALDGVSMGAATQLLDRLAAADEWSFILQWLEGLLSGRVRLDPALAVRLLRAYREVGRPERAREFAGSLPPSPGGWPALEAGRLSIERAIIATADGRGDHAEAELRLASRHLASAPKGHGAREQLDLHVASAQLELRLGRIPQATQSLRLAEHLAERVEDGAWRPPLCMTLGHLAMRLSDPRTAIKHYETALARSAARGAVAMHAHGNIAIALASVGRCDEARAHAIDAITLCTELSSSSPSTQARAGAAESNWRHADMFDVLAIVEIAADQPVAAVQAIDEALMILGDQEQPLLRYQLADHRTWALAVLGRADAARQWLAKAERLRADLSNVDVLDEQDLAATRARTLEACGLHKEALESTTPYLSRLPDAFVTGTLHLIAARCSLALGDEGQARVFVERAALSGDRHGWAFPDRQASLPLWNMAMKAGDSRVVRYAEKALGLATATPPPSSVALSGSMASAASISLGAPSTRSLSRMPSAIPPSTTNVNVAASERDLASASDMRDTPPHDGEALLYVTTPQGVARVPAGELAQAIAGATLVVDTLTHALRIDQKAISLERRRALEPLVVQLLRRAKEGLSAEEILRAAGGPGPESADAEHRVRVLISRVRDLLGDAATIERVRDAGEYGRTRYRLSAHVKFALIEPLFSAVAPS